VRAWGSAKPGGGGAETGQAVCGRAGDGDGATAAAAMVRRGRGMGSRGGGDGLKIFLKCGLYYTACRERRCSRGCEILANVGYSPIHSSVNR
jgi:hypothetical protein